MQPPDEEWFGLFFSFLFFFGMSHSWGRFQYLATLKHWGWDRDRHFPEQLLSTVSICLPPSAQLRVYLPCLALVDRFADWPLSGGALLWNWAVGLVGGEISESRLLTLFLRSRHKAGGGHAFPSLLNNHPCWAPST